MIAIINGKEYQLRDSQPFGYTNTLELYIISDSSDEIVETIGERATVTIPKEYTGNDLILNYICRMWDAGVSICEVNFKPIPIDEIAKNHTEDIEAISQAIVELAEIIGGDE